MDGATMPPTCLHASRDASRIGPPDDRFVYLSWRSVPGGIWINRVKARLGGIDWKMVRAAAAAGRPLEADMSGWRPHDNRRQVTWRMAKD